MSKYIDAEKLKAEIERYENTAIDTYNPHGEDADFWHGKVVAYEDLKTLVTSLQKEQPEMEFNEGYIVDTIQNLFPADQFIESEYLGLDREEALLFAHHFIKLGRDTYNKLPQMEISLRKFIAKIDGFQGRYKHPESVSIKGAMSFMARMFYMYPNVARQWYDSLPKATMN